jgi:hypothetical protein
MTDLTDDRERQRVAAVNDALSKDDELKQLRAKRAALAAARDARELQRTADEQIADERQGLIDDEAIEVAEREYGPVGKKILVVKTDMGAIIIKRSPHAAYKRFLDVGADDVGKVKQGEVERLVRPLVVHPPLATFDQIVSEMPLTMVRCSDAVAILAGYRRDVVSAK